MGRWRASREIESRHAGSCTRGALREVIRVDCFPSSFDFLEEAKSPTSKSGRDFKSNTARNYHISDHVRVTWMFDLFLPIERRFHQRLNVRRDFARGKKRRKRARDVVWSAARNRSRFAPRFALGNCTIDDCQFRWQLSISWTRIKSQKGTLTERHASTRVSAWPGDLT